MPGVIESFKSLYTLPVNRNGVLGQIVGSYGKEAYLLCKLGSYHYSCGGFNHNAKLSLTVKGYPVLFKLRHNRTAQALCLLHLPQTRYHRKHYSQLSICRCAVKRSQLRFEYLGAGKAYSECPHSKCGVFFVGKSEITYLLVRTDVHCSYDDSCTVHSLHNGLICFKLNLLGRKILRPKIKKFASEKPDSSCIIGDYGIHISGRGNIGVYLYLFSVSGNIRLSLELFKHCPYRLFFPLLSAQIFPCCFIGINNDITNASVHDDLSALISAVQINVCVDDRRNPQCSCKDGSVAVRISTGQDKSKYHRLIQLDGFAGSEVIRKDNGRLIQNCFTASTAQHSNDSV